VDARNWESVKVEGLKPAAVLVRAGLQASVADAFLRGWRSETATLPSGVVLRDQRPMPEGALERCLTGGLTSADWYDLVNEGVYFWVEEARLRRHLAAQSGEHVVLEMDGPALADAYASQAFVTPFNVGSATRRPARRGVGSFVRYREWRGSGWSCEDPAPAVRRSASHKPAELVIRAEIPDAMRFVRRLRSQGRGA
jgi:hypothetical protein